VGSTDIQRPRQALFDAGGVSHKAAGTATSEDEELLTEFYYRHFQITDEALQRLRENRPEVYQAVGEKLEKLRDMEFLTVESFENRLAKPDVLGPDDVVRYRRPVLKFARMESEPTEFVSDEDTHHLLYLPAVKPGWFAVGGKDDVPKHACYIGRYGNTYVWVLPENLEMLTRFTLAILDIHTYRSARIGGSRIQPGLLPRY
jgi:hypothetical protein